MSLKNTIDNLIKDVNATDMSDGDISLLRDKMKEVERILKDKSKPKIITISGDSHKAVKEYCNVNNINIGEWVSSVLLEKIENIKKEIPFYDFKNYYIERNYELVKNINILENCIINTTPELESERILKKYLKVRKEKNMYIKLNLFIDNDIFNLLGYDMVDGLPIFYIKEDDFDKWVELNMSITDYKELKNINRSMISAIPLVNEKED